MAEVEEVRVECYSGARFAERPVAIVMPGGRRKVAEILRAWRSPGELHFRLVLEDGNICHLIYDAQGGTWKLEQRKGQSPIKGDEEDQK